MAEAVVGEMRIPTKKAPKTRAGGVTMHARAFNISLPVAQTNEKPADMFAHKRA